MSDDILPTETGRRQGWRSAAVWIASAAFACSSVSTEPVDGLGNSLSRAGSGGSGPSETGAGGTNASGSSAGAAGSAAANGSNAGSGGSQAGSGSSGNAGAGATSSSGGSAGSASGALPDAGAAWEGTAANLIQNPGFETGLSPWTAAFGGTLSVTTEQAHGGLHSGKVSDRTYDYQGAHYDLTHLVSPSASYAVSAFGRVGNGTGATLKLTAQLTCSGEANPRYESLQEVTDAGDSAWTALSGTLTIPASSDCTLVQLLLYVEGPPAGYDVYVDDASVIPL